MSIAAKEVIRGLIRQQNFSSATEIMAEIKEMFKDVLQEVMEAELETELEKLRRISSAKGLRITLQNMQNIA